MTHDHLRAFYYVTVHYSSGHEHSTPCESLDEAIRVCRAKRATAPTGHSFVRIYGDGAEGGYGEDGTGVWDGLTDDERERVEAEGLL